MNTEMFKKYKEHVHETAVSLSERLEAIVAEWLRTPGRADDTLPVERVIEEFEKLPVELRSPVFWLMDETPRNVSQSHPYGNWYQMVRRCRNHPVHGKKLFATFR